MSTAKKRGLGRGLEALLGPKAAAEAPQIVEAQPGDALRTLPVDALTAGRYQPRRHWDEAKLAELAESIKAQGVIWPSAASTRSSPANAAGALPSSRACRRSRWWCARWTTAPSWRWR